MNKVLSRINLAIIFLIIVGCTDPVKIERETPNTHSFSMQKQSLNPEMSEMSLTQSILPSMWRNHNLYNSDNIIDRVITGDFDGDGKDDIAAFYDYYSSDDKIHVWLSTGSGFNYQGNNGWWNASQYNVNNITRRVVSGDFDGDGKDDIAAFYDYYSSDDKMHVWLSTGSSFDYQGNNGWWNASQYNSQKVTGKMISGDFNNDAKDDIAMIYNYSSNDKIHVLLSTGSSFDYQGNNGWANVGSVNPTSYTDLLTSTDIEGNGYDDFVFMNTSVNRDWLGTTEGDQSGVEINAFYSTGDKFVNQVDENYENSTLFPEDIVYPRDPYNCTNPCQEYNSVKRTSLSGNFKHNIYGNEFVVFLDDNSTYSGGKLLPILYYASQNNGKFTMSKNPYFWSPSSQTISSNNNLGKITFKGDFDNDSYDEIGYIMQSSSYMQIWIYD